jgi:hypothetical protein
VTTHVFYVTKYKKCTQTSKIIPYHRFRYKLPVPTVAWVHILNLKTLVCILVSMVATWDIGTKYCYEIPQGFEYRICTLTILTISTINILTKVVGRIKQWRDCLATMDRGRTLGLGRGKIFSWHNQNQPLNPPRPAVLPRRLVLILAGAVCNIVNLEKR